MAGSAGKADIIAVTILSNKMIFNDVKGKYGRPETGAGKGRFPEEIRPKTLCNLLC